LKFWKGKGGHYFRAFGYSFGGKVKGKEKGQKERDEGRGIGI